MTFILTDKGYKELENFIFEKDRRIWAHICEDKKKLVVEYEEYGSSYRETECFDIEKIPNGQNISNQIEHLQQEYEDGHKWGMHWDLLRWNWSKFFLGIETVMVGIAAKGMYELFKTEPSDYKMGIFLIFGLSCLSITNLSLCYVWAKRNLGIHRWHCNSIRRLKMIEFDPRLELTEMFYSTITRRLSKKPHRTGDLESWAPAAAFALFWIAVLIIDVFYCYVSWKVVL